MVQCILAPVNDAQLLVEVPNKKRKKYKFNPEFLKIILKQNDLINLNLFKFSPQVINNKNIKNNRKIFLSLKTKSGTNVVLNENYILLLNFLQSIPLKINSKYLDKIFEMTVSEVQDTIGVNLDILNYVGKEPVEKTPFYFNQLCLAQDFLTTLYIAKAFSDLPIYLS